MLPLALAAAALALVGGCVERRLIIRTDPPGARVFVDGAFVGRTGAEPVAVRFDFYGTREITCRLADYETARQAADLAAPWYAYPPIDFFAEVLWPFPIVDERTVEVALVPRPALPDPHGVAERAESARARLAAGATEGAAASGR